MYMNREVILATAKRIYHNTDRHRVKVNLWVGSQLDSANDATHVFVQKQEHLCTRYKGVQLLMEAVMSFVLEPSEELYAVTEDQAILGISTEPA